MPSTEDGDIREIAIIGGGPAGTAAARYVLKISFLVVADKLLPCFPLETLTEQRFEDLEQALLGIKSSGYLLLLWSSSSCFLDLTFAQVSPFHLPLFHRTYIRATSLRRRRMEL